MPPARASRIEENARSTSLGALHQRRRDAHAERRPAASVSVTAALATSAVVSWTTRERLGNDGLEELHHSSS